MKTTHTGNYLRTVLRHIVNFYNPLDWTVLLESFGVEYFDVQLDSSIQLGAFSSFVAQLNQNRFAVVSFDLRVGLDLQGSNHEEVLLNDLLLLILTHIIL